MRTINLTILVLNYKKIDKKISDNLSNYLIQSVEKKTLWLKG